ncbi:MAG: RNA polymerase sigma factor [Bacteroidetes bacterium]|jgi:RNA polymerase sigma-70 factor (ECF subfamily)|nr:RNA polymerase sigma factor [Bacteroidota bacterium]
MPHPSAHPDEPRWVERSRTGDHTAFRSLYEHHVAGLYRFLAQFSGSSSDIEEWVQRAFVKAYQHLREFDGRSSFATWLFRIGINEMRTDLRRRKILAFEPVEQASSVVGDDESERLPWSETLREALDRLDDLKRSVFILYEVEGFSHREIAGMLSIEESHSRTILARTKSLLRSGLSQERAAR